MGLLGDIYSAIDTKKRQVKGLLDDFGGTVDMGVRRFREDQQGLQNLFANAYPMAGDKTVLNSPQQIAQFQREAADKAGEMGLAGAITPATRPILEQMSKQSFLGNPKIVGKSDAKDLIPIELRSLSDVDPVPFMGGKYQAKYSPNGAVVLDDGKPIASYNFGDTLTVDKKYRKKGIGSELVYQQRTFYPEPAGASTRNKVSQNIQENVWDRIQADLKNMDGLLK